MKRIIGPIVILAIGWLTPCVQAQALSDPPPLQPFSPETNYMSVPGYLRWRDYLASGKWADQELVKFSEEYTDSQEGGADGVTGMDIDSVTPEKVNYSLRLNDGASINLPYKPHVIHPKGIFGDVIRIDLETTFRVGSNYHYLLTRFIAEEGLLDKIGNTFNFENGQHTQTYRFHLESGPDGSLWVSDEISQKKIQARNEQGIFYLPSLAPLSGTQE